MATTDQETAFIKFIRESVLPSPRSRAVLKRTLRGDPRFIIQALKFVAPFQPRPGWDEEAFILTAALYSLHPLAIQPTEEKPHTPNFGASFGTFASRTYGAGPDRRFVRLIDVGLRSSENALRRHLFSMVMFLRKESIPVDWAKFLHDIRHWGHPGRWAQRRWARSFYATLDTRLKA